MPEIGDIAIFGQTIPLDMGLIASFGYFNLDTHTVIFSVDDESHGELVGNTSQTVPHGGSATSVKADAFKNYDFNNWTGSVTSTENPLTLTNVTSNMSVQANFVREFDNNQMFSGSQNVNITFDTDSTDFSPAVFGTRGRIPLNWSFPE